MTVPKSEEACQTLITIPFEASQRRLTESTESEAVRIDGAVEAVGAVQRLQVAPTPSSILTTPDGLGQFQCIDN